MLTGGEAETGKRSQVNLDYSYQVLAVETRKIYLPIILVVLSFVALK